MVVEQEIDYFTIDSIGTVYNRVVSLDKEIEAAASRVRMYGKQKADATAHYEDLKNTRLLAMFEEENAGIVPKRTEKHRQALYRSAFAKERLEMMVAEMMYDASKAYLDGLESCLTAAQTRQKILTAEEERMRKNYA